MLKTLLTLFSSLLLMAIVRLASPPLPPIALHCLGLPCHHCTWRV
jgi:hypothetical protein